MNLNEFMQLIKKGSNPEQLVLTMLEQNAGDNPMLLNMLQLVKQKKTDELEQVVRNAAKEKGIDFDSEFNAFKTMIGFK